jgi:cell wall-associated NlpC family hydrolase
MYSAAATTAAATIAALFSPVPALAAPLAPLAPQAPLSPAVPDVGSRPVPLGTLTLPGQPAPSAPTTAPIVGAAASPVLQKIEKGRAEIATLGDQLIALGQERDLARDQHTAAELKYRQAVQILQQAQAAAADAAAASMRQAASVPPGTYESGLIGLDDLARMQRGSGDSDEAVARRLESAQMTVQLALGESTVAQQRWNDLIAQYAKLNTDVNKKQAAQQALELAHADELSAAETTETAADSALGAQYLAGAEAGRGADPRSLQALQFALAQRGDPYVWSEEGPDQYDCSGLTYAAYRSVGFPLMRVSRDQYWQTRNKVVDRYSLLPGDLLFFSYSNSWRGIHHVAMYAGNGMMVEAPRTGLNVRLVPVRWTRLFQATRVFGSVEGVSDGPELGSADPDPTTPPTTTSPATTPPTTTKPTTPPASTPTSPSTPTTPPSSQPTSPSTPPSSPPTTSPSPSPSPTPSPSPSTTPTTPAPTTTSPSAAETSSEPSSAGSSEASSAATGSSTSASASS